MFSKQLEYSYLMYMYLKENPEKYIYSDDIIEKTDVPKRWGRMLLSNMVSKGLIISKKGRGFMFVEKEMSFWEFYVLTEETSKNQSGNFNQIITDKNEKRYQSILLKIGMKVQNEMMNIKI
ncbi:hypothetical protein [Cetobacterium somerae]|uniref:hypothetical protein n=1 Tax=Cetobacterium somerae TaxID=188913 RepID=UPI003891CC68